MAVTTVPPSGPTPPAPPRADTLKSTAPATGEVLGEVPVCSAAEVTAAVARARAAAAAWSALSYREREGELVRWRQAVAEAADELADLIHRENGKPRLDALVEVFMALSHLDHAAQKVLAVGICLAMAAAYFAGLYLYRRSIRFRVTSSNIESERGILSKKIDVLELWRCRDIRYKQNLLDRMLGIAHIELFTADVSTPHLEMIGLPASRQPFEQIRDGIELQRQARNVYGVVS